MELAFPVNYHRKLWHRNSSAEELKGDNLWLISLSHRRRSKLWSQEPLLIHFNLMNSGGNRPRLIFHLYMRILYWDTCWTIFRMQHDKRKIKIKLQRLVLLHVCLLLYSHNIMSLDSPWDIFIAKCRETRPDSIIIILVQLSSYKVSKVLISICVAKNNLSTWILPQHTQKWKPI